MTNSTSLVQSSSFDFFTNNSNSISKKFPSPPAQVKDIDVVRHFESANTKINCSLFDLIGRPKLESKLPSNKKLAEKEFLSLLNLLKKHRIYISYLFPFSINFSYKTLKENLLKIKVNDLKSENYIQIINFEQLLDTNLITPIQHVFNFCKIINSRNWKPLIEIMDELIQIGNYQFGSPQLLEYQNRYFENWNNLELKSTSIILAQITENIAQIHLEISIKKHPKAKTQLLQFQFELNEKFDWWVIHKIISNGTIDFK